MRLALRTYVDAVLNVLTKTILGFSSKPKIIKLFYFLRTNGPNELECLSLVSLSAKSNFFRCKSCKHQTRPQMARKGQTLQLIWPIESQKETSFITSAPGHTLMTGLIVVAIILIKTIKLFSSSLTLRTNKILSVCFWQAFSVWSNIG